MKKFTLLLYDYFIELTLVLAGIAFIIITNTAHAQNNSLKIPQVPVNINFKDSTCRFFCEPYKKKIKIKEEYIYYWYAFNSINKTQGKYDGKLLNGEYVAFYLDNNILSSGNFKYGLKSGKWISWYQTGMIKEISYYRNSLLSGPNKKFNSDGKLIQEAYFKDNKLNGKLMVYNGDTLSYTTKYKKGIIVPEKEKKHKDKTNKKPDEKLKKTTESKSKTENWFRRLWKSIFHKSNKKNAETPSTH